MTHIMIDLETMSSASNAAIIAIGAVVIWNDGIKQGNEFYQKILPNSSESLGLHVSRETMEWWNNQDPAVRAEAFSGTTRLESVLWAFQDWCSQIDSLDNIHIWGKGADFDPVVLRNAYETHTSYPFDFRKHRCYRTIDALAGYALRDFPAIAKHEKHTALGDARYQASRIQYLIENLDLKLE